MNKLFIITEKLHHYFEETLSKKGFHFLDLSDKSTEEIFANLKNCVGVVVRNKYPIDKNFLDYAPNLKVICRAGAGLDNIDLELTSKKNITILNAPEGNRDAVGEHTISMILSLLTKLQSGNLEVKSKIWNREANRGWELKYKTVGIFGYGNTGQAVAEKLKGFGCKIIAYDKYKSNFGNEYVEEVSLDDFIKHTQIATFHIPLSNETKYLFDYSFFKKFAQLQFLINTSRGKILVIKDLLQILQKKEILGVGLDVLENEKFNTYTEEEHHIFQSISQYSNVIFSPHVAGWTYESYFKISEVLANKVLRLEAEGFFSQLS